MRRTSRSLVSARPVGSDVVGAARSGYHRDILRSCPFQNLLGALRPIGIVRMHREEESGHARGYEAGSLNAVTAFCMSFISASESRNASVDSAPSFMLTRSTCNASQQPPEWTE